MSTAFTAGVATIARAATLYWNSSAATPPTGAIDGSGNWAAGGTVFFNPLTGTDVAAGTSDIATFGNGGILSSTAKTVNVTEGAERMGAWYLV